MEEEIRILASKPWRRRILEHAIEVLVIFELILSLIFFVLVYLTNDAYFRGVAVGLLISWVTGGIIILFKRQIDSKIKS